MLFDVDVPFDGPQTLAYRVPAKPLLQLRDALRAAYERGDGGPLREQWGRHVHAYAEARDAVRWRVPSSTIQGFTREVRTACSLGAAWIGTDPAVPTRDHFERLLAQCDRLESLVTDATHLYLPPDRWLGLILSARPRLRAFLRSPETSYQGFFMEFFTLGLGTDSMEKLELPCEVLDDWGLDTVRHNEHPRPGELEKTAKVRFLLASEDETTDEIVTRREAHVSEVEAYDWVRLADGSELKIFEAWDLVSRLIKVDEQVERIVGPYVPTRGPGPFLLPPTCATRLVDTQWDLLELYRAREDDEEPGLGWQAPYWFVHSSTLDEAIAEIENEEHCRRSLLVCMGRRNRRSEGWGRGSACWKTWHEVQLEWWPDCRERYRALLGEACSAGDAIVFTEWFPDDQGTITAPMSEDLGERVMVDPRTVSH